MTTITPAFHGIGVGPGDPELITLKACRVIAQVEVIAFLVNDKGESQAKNIACEAIRLANKKHIELPVFMPMDENRYRANAAYDVASADIEGFLHKGLSVAFLCEGDPLFYGSFIYLLQRLSNKIPCQIIPGISSLHAASAALQTPLTQQSETLSVISGRVSDAEILQKLRTTDSLVILKAGLNRPRLMTLIEKAERQADTQYIEYISRDQQRILTDFDQLIRESGPYFSLFLITRHSR